MVERQSQLGQLWRKIQLSRGIISMIIRTALIVNRERIINHNFQLSARDRRAWEASRAELKTNQGCKMIIVQFIQSEPAPNHHHYESWWRLLCSLLQRSPPRFHQKPKMLFKCVLISGAIIHFLLSQNCEFFLATISSTNLQYWAHSSFVIGSSSQKAEHLIS